MNKIGSLLLALVLVVSFCFAAAASDRDNRGGFMGDSKTSVNAGGFSGPGIGAATVEQAKTMRDDAQVVIPGNIVQHLGKDKYLFRDGTGTITVEIDKKRWGGQIITPNDTVELHGEIDKDWNSVEIDVDRVIKK